MQIVHHLVAIVVAIKDEGSQGLAGVVGRWRDFVHHSLEHFSYS
jgi:hypothetical protein